MRLSAFVAAAFLAVPSAAHDGPMDDWGCHEAGKGAHCHEGRLDGRSFPDRRALKAAQRVVDAGLTETLAGLVVGVSDGDTVKVLHSGRSVTIRLYGVDCPEKRQPFGAAAKQASSSLVFGKEVSVRIRDVDRYGRAVGEVSLDGKETLNRELVRRGLAWWYREYAPDDAELGRLEAEAKKAKRGLWSEKAPEAPWAFRREKRQRPAAAAF